jgi:hypothetical protein
MQTGQLHADALIGRLGGHETPSVVRSLIVKKPLGLRPPATSCRCHPGGYRPKSLSLSKSKSQSQSKSWVQWQRVALGVKCVIVSEPVAAVTRRYSFACGLLEISSKVGGTGNSLPVLRSNNWGLDIFPWLRRGLSAAWNQMLAIRLLLVPSVSGSESGSGSIPLECHRNDSVTETIGPADIRDRFTVHIECHRNDRSSRHTRSIYST